MKSKPSDLDLDPRATAGVDLIGRTGAKSFQIRFSDDELPVVWLAVASYPARNALTGKPIDDRSEAAAAIHPTTAIMRLCELLIDGGTCTHCQRATIFVPDSDTSLLDLVGCVYAYDPELQKFRRDCEGD